MVLAVSNILEEFLHSKFAMLALPGAVLFFSVM